MTKRSAGCVAPIAAPEATELVRAAAIAAGRVACGAGGPRG
ncbi:MAG TPA: hypothetical protein VN849_04165 [Stellaceae bacterium]|nr:hypothetical protein [Stellaceae bacterium]